MSQTVNHPAHYLVGGIEAVDYIRAKLGLVQFRSYCLGNVLKYVSRAPYKEDMRQDLEKAKWYLERILAELPEAVHSLHPSLTPEQVASLERTGEYDND